jgi:hypothetical protein
MIVEFFIVPLAGCALLLLAVWRGLTSLATALHWPSWAPFVAVAGVASALLILAVICTLLHDLRKR